MKANGARAMNLDVAPRSLRGFPPSSAAAREESARSTRNESSTRRISAADMEARARQSRTIDEAVEMELDEIGTIEEQFDPRATRKMAAVNESAAPFPLLSMAARRAAILRARG